MNHRFWKIKFRNLITIYVLYKILTINNIDIIIIEFDFPKSVVNEIVHEKLEYQKTASH